MKKNLIIIGFLVVVVIGIKIVYPKFFTNLLVTINHEGSLSGNPFLETCIQSDILAYDKINGNSVKYIGCIKGYVYTPWESKLISQVTDGYLISDKNQKVVSIIPIQKYNDHEFFNEFEKNGYPRFSLKENGLFISEKTTTSNSKDLGVQQIKVSELFSFHDNKIEKIRDILVGNTYVLALKNNEIFYTKNNQSIIKENILSGELTTLLNSDKLKKDPSYNSLYNVCIPEKRDDFIATFKITTDFDNKTRKFTDDYYSINLNSGELKKIGFNGNYIINSNCTSNDKEIIPPKITYSYLEGIASAYNLTYMPNREMDVYNFLLQKKGGTKHELPQ